MRWSWNKPVLVLYRERRKKPERKAFAVIKARTLTVSETKGEDAKYTASLKDFFPLMGDFEYVLSEQGMADRYVLCWFEDKEDDFTKAWRRLGGVAFPNKIKVSADKKGKKTYNAKFTAEYGKLK